MPTPFFADLVRELCQEGGTGPLTPTGAVPGHRRFADCVPAETPFHYAVAGIAQPGQWEVGIGRLDASGRLLRETISASSNGGAAVDFAVGMKTIALTVGAAWFADNAAAIEARQPLSTGHEAVAAGAAGDLLTVRRGSGWVNVPLSALAFRDAGGRYDLGGVLGAPGGSAAAPSFGFASDPDTGLFRAASDVVAVATGGSERVRIGATGLVGIGTAAPAHALDVQGASGSALARIKLAGSSYSGIVIAGDANGGWIGNAAHSTGEGLYCHNAANTLRFYANSAERLRIESAGAVRPAADNSQSSGTAASRWSVVYAGTGTINTSDAREKSWRGAATAAELDAARRIAAELGFFQWNDAIALKGAAGARYHFGVRAQRVWAIMAEAGLIDPPGPDGRPGATPYAFLCWDEWGAGEDRFGIRPDQLALFLIAAQEQRLAALEGAA